MKYYKLIYDYENDDNYINCNVGDIVGMNEYITSNGMLIKDWNLPIFRYDSIEGNIMSDYVANVYRWLIVSDAFYTVVDNSALSMNIQYLPVKIIDTISNAETEMYKAANILDLVDALDLENSKYDIFELDDEKIISVEKYSLKASAIQGLDVFRLKGDTIPVFVSEQMKKLIEENGLKGFAFLEVAVY